MKKILFFVATALLTAGMMTSCKDKKAPADEQQKESIFNKQDTLKVRELSEQFITNLKNKDVKAAVEMLRYLDGDSVKAYDPQNLKRQAFALSIMAGKPNYEIEFIKMRDEIDNEVKINISLFETKEGDNRPNTTPFYLRPVRLNGQWYLTTRDNFTDTHSELRDAHPNE